LVNVAGNPPFLEDSRMKRSTVFTSPRIAVTDVEKPEIGYAWSTTGPAGDRAAGGNAGGLKNCQIDPVGEDGREPEV
jgi:hypothetical protein